MLSNIITSLKARYIFLIENDFHYETDVQVALSKFVLLGSFHLGRVIATLEPVAKQLSDSLLDFKKTFEALPHKKELWQDLLPDDLAEYLKQIGEETLLTHAVVDILSKEIDKPEIGEILLRSGIFQNASKHYDQLLENLKSIADVELVYYRSVPAPAELEEFTNDLHSGVKLTGSEFYVGIIDKMLGEGEEESGKKFIETDLIQIKSTTSLKGLTFLFTSKADITMPTEVSDFFKREIGKDDVNLIETIKSYLTDASYVTVFEGLTKDYIKSAEDALALTLRNQANIKHIVSESMNEGISPYDSLNIWFDLVIQSKREAINVNSIKYHSSLARFFNNNSDLKDHEGIAEYGEDLQKLNAFELFDTNVNDKKLPIYPGDIFESNGTYFILIGQACDTLLRKTLKRGAKIAEFLKIELRSASDFKEKYSIEIRDKKKIVTIQHFFNPILQVYQAIDIEISVKNLFYSDFECIDLCYYSDDGQAKIDLSKNDLESESFSYAEDKVSYYSQLKNFFNDRYSYPIALNRAFPSEAYLKSNLTGIKLDEVVDFGFRRVSRLKGRFYDSLYHQVIINKSRIDLNMIDASKETSEMVTLKVSFANSMIAQTVSVPLKNTNGKLYFESEVLANSLNAQFKDRILAQTTISVEKNNEFSLSKEQQEPNTYSLVLSVKYRDKNNSIKSVPANGLIKLSRLYDYDDTLADKTVTFLDDNSQGDLKDKTEISISDIEKGIKITANNNIISLQKGTVKIEQQ